MWRAMLVLLLTTSLAAQALRAQEVAAPPAARSGITLSLGSLGVGVEGNRQLNPHLGMRVSAHYLQFGYVVTPEEASFRSDWQMQSVRAVVDVYPFKRAGVHVKGGVVAGDRRIQGSGIFDMDGMIPLNGTEYSFAELGELQAEVKFPAAAPYLGIGFSRPVKRGLKLSLAGDIGVLIGAARLTLTSSNPGSNPALAEDLRAEQDRIQEKLDRFRFIPITQMVALSYRF